MFGLSEFGGLSALVTCPHAELVDFIDESCSDEAILRARVDALGKAYKDHPTVGLSPRGGAAEGQAR